MGAFDPACASLLRELNERGCLQHTLVVCVGEFGRTPKINPLGGRDHWPKTWTAMLAGGGIQGGQAVGKTSADGTEVADRPVSVPDLFATICKVMRIGACRPCMTDTVGVGVGISKHPNYCSMTPAPRAKILAN